MNNIEYEAVKIAVNNYLSGTREADAEKLQAAFYSSTNLHSLDDQGRLEIVPRDRFIEFTGGGKLPTHTNEIINIEIVNDMALAKVHFDLPDREFIDYLTLLKIKTVGWKIVSKTYTTLLKG